VGGSNRNRFRRSSLAVPGSDWRKLEKAAESEADEVIVDLEDAVPEDQKLTARATVIDALTSLDFGRKTRAVRINDVRTPYAFRDITDLVCQAEGRLDCLVIPKVESAADVHFVHLLLAGLEAELEATGRVGLELLIESAAGVVAIREILTASDRVEAVVFGPGDYSVDMGLTGFDFSGEDDQYPGHRWHWVMSKLAAHARASGLQAIDGPTVTLRERAAYDKAATWARRLGFHGKWCIHPDQVPWANEAFTVSPEELRLAEDVVAAYESAKRDGRGAAVVDGLMIDEASRQLASAIVDLARTQQRLDD
jgi:citrate lyase beta subunit